jgi:hypothetical protein
MFNEWFKPAAFLEYPRGGSQAIVNALVRCAARAIDPPAPAQPCERPPVPAVFNKAATAFTAVAQSCTFSVTPSSPVHVLPLLGRWRCARAPRGSARAAAGA